MSEAKTVEEAKAPAPAAPAPVKPAETAAPAPAPAVPITDFVGHRIAKRFGKKNFFGAIMEKWTVQKDSSTGWHVKYDDGDEEDFNRKELDNALKRYQKAKRFDYKINPKKARTASKKRKIQAPPPRSNKFPKRGTSKKD